jgi:cytochrome c-type biogenesis protein CcmE
VNVIRSKSVPASVLMIAALLVGVGAAQQKEEPLKVTPEELARDPAKFHGKRVRVEGVVQETQTLKEKQGEYDYRLVVGKGGPLMAWCSGKLAVRKGDAVRITGEFQYEKVATNPLRILAGGKDAKVEKVPPKKAK